MRAAEEKRIDAALGGAVEYFPRAVGEAEVTLAGEHRYPQATAGSMPHQQGGGPRNRRRGADGHVLESFQHRGDGGDEQFLYLMSHYIGIRYRRVGRRWGTWVEPSPQCSRYAALARLRTCSSR